MDFLSKTGCSHPYLSQDPGTAAVGRGHHARMVAAGCSVTISSPRVYDMSEVFISG